MDMQLKMMKMMASACRYSYTRLSLNYCLFSDMLSEPENRSETVLSCCREYVEIMDHFLQDRGSDQNLQRLDDLRKKVIGYVESITAYTDCFQIYEYVLNRLERKFEEDYPMPEEDGVFAARLLQFIAGSKDSAVVNGRIQSVLSQLPIRFTKAKFFSMVQESLGIYVGSPKQSLDDMMYMLTTETMVKKPEHMAEGYETAEEILKQFQNMDVKNMTKDSCREYINKLTFVSELLVNDSSDFMVLMDVINDLYVIILTAGRSLLEVDAVNTWHAILSDLTEKLKKGAGEYMDDAVLELLESLEGKQERYYESYLKSAGDMDTENHEDSRKINILLSSSPFASLEKEEEDLTEVDRKIMEKEAEGFFKSLEELWKDMPRVVVRASMAKVLSTLPVCFNSLEQVKEYIEGSLGSCSDLAEKSISQELLNEIMESENGLV